LDAVVDRHDPCSGAGLLLGPQELLAATVEVFRDYFAARAALRELWFQRRGSDMVRGFTTLTARSYPGSLHATAGQYVTDPGDMLNYCMVIEVSRVLWELAFRLDPAGDPEVVQEIHLNASASLRRCVFES